ncbi:ribosomal L7Ae/L30e/S12e/Gadd45 family protein [Paenibacillus sp. PsM32]|uniref:L7Ae/L30e/S12e/Gadd45 family ribosomal protein n=2 Tax=Paenibacillus TaxID=44249 RepID=A0ABW4UWS9_9BACL|nr:MULTISPECIES: ribosomal L7Ae/L30e/S12e/Gadd45 family protein [Paenibacillus]MDN4616508.1 ribosomal L7Ae/L30e/S12e/Gadd45 family protein [Paenibacillus sp. PsM32]MDQ1233703.1 ribosomal protein L7Ae-like RNA K-turn-binding protein [Paenibacillus sp. SORGH_AS_0306]MDR6110744.1 ribosomal protein L7Ae-like RNA K-turn-binding protein [Paenibacillus sp. SORGH_AS_0338]WCT57625.1 ribosomal L7Ae/L30e/S12e/Gadd45 family protein [Paenibacillus kyungheensis]WDF49276.1 ribosomal L7Ae/L30e/S12e/Gadd45 fam
MNNELSLLGLAMRAGKVLSGDELVLKAIRSREATLVVLAGDASDNTQKKFRDKCGSYTIPLLIGYDRDQLGSSIGKDGRVVLALTDKGFAELFRKRMGNSSEVEYIEHTGAEG